MLTLTHDGFWKLDARRAIKAAICALYSASVIFDRFAGGGASAILVESTAAPARGGQPADKNFYACSKTLLQYYCNKKKK